MGIRTITGMPFFIKNSVLLKSANFPTIQNLIILNLKQNFIKTLFPSTTKRLLGQTNSTPSTKRITKLNRLSYKLNKN